MASDRLSLTVSVSMQSRHRLARLRRRWGGLLYRIGVEDDQKVRRQLAMAFANSYRDGQALISNVLSVREVV